MHKKQKQKFILVAVVAVAVGAFSFARFLQIIPMPAFTDRLPETIATKPIDEDTSIAGQPEAQEVQPEEKSPEPQPETTPPIKDKTELSHMERVAPKQAEITKQVQHEYTYNPVMLPNDTFAGQWAHSSVRAADAWDRTTGAPVVIAVIDTGFGLNHEDLTDSWHTNQGEVGLTVDGNTCWDGSAKNKSSNNCDDDANGYVDDWRGWDFATIDNNPQAGQQNPYGAGVSHGTIVSGLVGATTNNSKGIASLNWSTKIMPLQALSDAGPGTTSQVVAAINYAVDNGAKIINMSLGSTYNDPLLQPAIDYAYANDVIVIAAAGNCGTGAESGCIPSQPGIMIYPGQSRHVISVGAVDASDNRASFSSYGPKLDVVAPGSGSLISPTWSILNPTSGYTGSVYGTSISTPIVTSVASLIKSVRPNAKHEEILSLLSASARKPAAMGSALYSNQYGHGIVDANTAIMVAQSINDSSPSPILAQAGSNISEHTFQTTSLLGSGCSLVANSYCTVWLRNSSNDYDRFLPYQMAQQNSQTNGWTWSASMLTAGEWSVYAVNGTKSSDPYYLFSK